MRISNTKSSNSLISLARVLSIPLLIGVWFIVFIYSPHSHDTSFRGSKEKVIKMFPEVMITKDDYSRTNHLVIVAGHAVLRAEKLNIAHRSDSGWYLLPYQKNRGYPAIIVSHIQKGVEVSLRDEKSLLIFSGGQTRKDVGPLSEGLSYYLLSEQNQYFPIHLMNRIFLEEFAKDSYENLLFSICRFREITNHYPSKITVVGFDFKSYRFTELHRKAIHFPIQNFSYIGLHVNHRNFDYHQAQLGENIAVEEFMNDLYGCKNPELQIKRKKRNPFYRKTPYELSCPEIKNLLKWCKSILYNQPQTLPWYIDSQ
jgi:hypothetical protein